MKKVSSSSSGFHHFFAATQNSLRGIRDAFLTAAAFRQECALLIVHYVALFLVPMCVALRLVLVILGPILLATELLNSAVEAVIDIVSPEWNLKARYAKDFGSAAVFMVLLLIVALWVIAIVAIL